MPRLAQHRQLQASVPGLEGLDQAVGDALASQCQSRDSVLIVVGGGGREIELLAQRDIFANLTMVDPCPGSLRQAKAMAESICYRAPFSSKKEPSRICQKIEYETQRQLSLHSKL